MGAELSTQALRQGGSPGEFRVYADGQPVSRGEVEEKSMLPKAIWKGGSKDRLVCCCSLSHFSDGCADTTAAVDRGTH